MFISHLIEAMHNTSTTLMFGALFILCMMLIIFLVAYFGKEGLYIYSTVAIITSNIQVLKAINIDGFDAPVPLGDIVFTSLFLVGDIITECWGRLAAQKGIWLGFASSLMFSIIMFIVVGMEPLSAEFESNEFFVKSHNAMAILFTPSFSILAASLIAYFTSLWFDVGIFHLMKITFKDKYLWLRTFVSSSIGITIDTIVFSLFAWVVFAVSSLSWEIIVNTYMINAIKIRIFLVIVSIPVFYLVRKIISKQVARQNLENLEGI